MKILLVSDTHLAARANDFNQNWQLVAGWVKESGAELTIHLGDISAAGNEQVEDLLFAKDVLSQFECELHLVPGNHDIGDNMSHLKAANHEVINADSLQRYREVFGQDYWSLQVDDWQLIGLNAQLFGSAGQEEQRMFDWLQDVLSQQDHVDQLKPRPVGIFLHKPLFRQQADEEDHSDRYVPQQPREQLLQILAAYDLRFVISGHTHQYRRIQVAGVEHIWMPSTSFCIPDAAQERIGQKIVGVMMLTLDEAEHHATMVNIKGMQRHNLLDQIAVYPQVAGVKHKLGAEGEL